MVTVKDIARYITLVYSLQTDCMNNICMFCKCTHICAIYEVTIDKLLTEGVY